jgi:hypothetical protein
MCDKLIVGENRGLTQQDQDNGQPWLIYMNDNYHVEHMVN